MREPHLRPSGGYRQLRSFEVATIIYDATVAFCARFVDKRSRTVDQMVQAARSGRQNIAEGSRASAASSQTELRLVNVARASLDELLLDYEDFLRQRGLPQWTKDHVEARRVRQIGRQARADAAAYEAWLKHQDPAVVANATLCLIHQANYLLDQQIAALERQFVQGGGYSERLAAARLEHRRQADRTDPSDPSDRSDLPACPLCGRPMVLRTARQGGQPGAQFLGCSGYPDCRGTRRLDAPADLQLTERLKPDIHQPGTHPLPMSSDIDAIASRCEHLGGDNPLRALTEVIARVPGGINLGQGVCDMGTPAPLVEGAIQSIGGGEDRQTYTHYSGLPELKEQLRRKLRSFNQLDFADDEVLVAAGSSGAFTSLALAVFEPGDEVILFEPFYSYHRSTLTLLGCRPVSVPLRTPDFGLDVGRLRAALGPRTRAVVINTPANPSGKVFSREELQDIARALAGTRVLVVTDEVYEYMCFDGRQHVSPATIDGLAERTLTLGSFSKTFSITGWRIGYLAGSRRIVEMAGRVFDQVAVCAARPMQRGVARALRDLPPSFYAELGTTYQRKRDRFCDALATAGFRFTKPNGAYYVLADYRDVLGDIEPYAAALQLIERIGVNGVPGYVFYEKPDGVRSIRFQFAVEPAVLEEVCQRFARLHR